MSHYCVMVITKDGNYKDALKPYDESIVVPRYISKTRQEVIAEALKDKERYDNNDEKFNRQWFEGYYKDVDFNDEESIIAKQRRVYEEEMDEEGNIYSTYNPLSKWDWYALGGRFAGTLKLKKLIPTIEESELSWTNGWQPVEKGYTDFAQVKDIDFTPDNSKRAYYERFWEINVEGQEPKDEKEREEYRAFFNKNYYLNRYENKEDYIQDQTEFRTYAVLNHGEWIEPGEMGWWGWDNSTKDSLKEYRKTFKEIVANLDPEDYIAIVDCHI